MTRNDAGSEQQSQTSGEVNANAFESWLVTYQDMNPTYNLKYNREGNEISVMLQVASQLDFQSAVRDIVRMLNMFGGRVDMRTGRRVMTGQGNTWSQVLDCLF